MPPRGKLESILAIDGGTLRSLQSSEALPTFAGRRRWANPP